MNVVAKSLKGYFMRVIGTMALVAALAIPGLAAALPAGAQDTVITPTDYGRGFKLGIQQFNNSGQVGWVILEKRNGKTALAISLEGTRGTERAQLHRARSCDSVADIDPAVAAPLSDVVNGKSTTTINLPIERALSGNYAVVVRSASGPYFACGHLRQEIGL
jgi:hypothetical protein